MFYNMMVLEPTPGVRFLALPRTLGFSATDATGLMAPNIPLSAAEVEMITGRLEHALNVLASMECEGSA